MALMAALLGWMFDGLEMGLFPLVAGPAISDLVPNNAAGDVGFWLGVATAAFLIGAATGGVLFGWLGDRVGRVRAMMLSVLTYAIFSGLCGAAQSPMQIAVLRFVSALGMGGEWSLGVALVMEIWPDSSRALLAGLIGAAANFGYLLIAAVGLGLTSVLAETASALRAIGLPESWVVTLVAHDGWRLLMMTGALPALLTFFIRLFVPESERWQEEKARGTTSHWATHDLIGVLIGAGGGMAIIYLWAEKDLSLGLRIAGSVPALVVITVGYLYPVTRFLQRAAARESDAVTAWKAGATVPPDDVGQPFVSGTARESASSYSATIPNEEPTASVNDGTPPFQTGSVGSLDWALTLRRLLLGAGLGGIALLGTWGSIQWAPTWANEMTKGAVPQAKAYTQICSAGGAVIGTMVAALAGGWLGRRITYFLLCLGSLASSLILYQLNTSYTGWFLACVFMAGGLTASFYGWLPLYLPELFPTKVRATGQGFSFNFGRVIAAIGALQGSYLIKNHFEGDYATVCSIMSLIYLVGLGFIWLAPETKGQPLPE
jgi:MFS family permease